MVANSEPMPAIINKIKSKNLTIWDYYKLDTDLKVDELLQNLSEYFDLEIDTIAYESKLLISPLTSPLKTSQRKAMMLSELFKEFKIEVKKSYNLQIDCLMEDDEYNLPNVKIELK